MYNIHRLYFVLFVLFASSFVTIPKECYISPPFSDIKPFKPIFEGKKKGRFYVIRIEEFEKFYILHLKRRNRLYKTVSPKNLGKGCRQVSLNGRYYFSLIPMLGGAGLRNMAMHSSFYNIDYYDEVITMERNNVYARNIYELKKYKDTDGVCVVSGY
jgi:hypothetical protein